MLLITQPVPTARLQTPPVARQDLEGHLPLHRVATSREQPQGTQHQDTEESRIQAPRAAAAITQTSP